MKRLQAFKYELMPDGGQQRTMRRCSGSCRFVFNKALALQKERFEQGEKKLGYGGLCKQLTEWKAEPNTAWLKDTPSQALQQSLKDLERAYANFFARRAEFRRFKKKGYSDSFRYPQGKSAAGSVETPGRNVKAKSGLNKSILDQGWHEFRRQLEYKQAWRGGQVMAVNPRNTSRTCPDCAHVSAENRRTQAHFRCVDCGFEENADLVGAINVLRRGEAMLSMEGQDTGDASLGCSSTARIACEVNGAIKPSAAGTHRSDSNKAPCPA